MTDKYDSAENQKGDIGERAFEDALRRLGFIFAEDNCEPFVCDIGFYMRPQANAWHDASGRTIADFEIVHTTGFRARDAHIDVKCHDGWHWYADKQTWQAGVGIGLLRDYQARAQTSSQRTPCSAHIIIIKRGFIPLGKRDGLPLPHHPSPVGVWIAAVDELIEQGFEHYIPNERGIGRCSTRAVDGGLWRPFAPWCEATKTIIVRRSENPAAWDSFFAREMAQAVLP